MERNLDMKIATENCWLYKNKIKNLLMIELSEHIIQLMKGNLAV